MYFIPFIGRLIDKIGVKKVLYFDALSFIFVYISYGLLVYGLVSGYVPKSGIYVSIAYSIVIIDKMSSQMGMARTIYLKDILVKRSDFTPSMSLGMSMDHTVSIRSSLYWWVYLAIGRSTLCFLRGRYIVLIKRIYCT